MGSKGSTTTSTMQPPKEVTEMYKYLTEQGKSLQQQPYQPYQGQLVADMNAVQQGGLAQAQQYSQAAQPYLQQAGQMTQQAYAGYNPQNYATGVAGYMSPYLQNAMSATAAQMQNINEQQQQKLLGNAVSAGAFGGDRGKIAQAALMNQQNLASGQVLSNMANQGYQDAARNYLSGLGQQGALAAQYGTVGTTAQQQGLAGAQAMMQAGNTPYQIEQAKLAAQYGQYAQGQAYPWQTLGYLANIASGLGAGQGGTSTTTSPGPNMFGQILGGLTALGSMPWSDKRLKEDIHEVGKTFDGQPIYSFKYKGDKTTHIGLMAQDVEKKHPEAVGLAAGYKTVDYEKATEDAAERGHFASGGESMGGLVPADQMRHPYATAGSVGILPYIEDPLYELESQYSKVPLISFIPSGLSVQKGGVGIPDAPKPYEDTGISDVTKGIQAMTPNQKANLVANIKDLTGYYNVSGDSGLGGSANQAMYADGGLVPREHHADGQKVDLPDVPYGSTSPTIFEHITGMDLSPDARAGMLAAGLGMMASRSPFLGTAIGEGGLAGINTYYNAIKNRYDVQKNLAELGLRGREVGVQEAGIPLRSAEVQNAIITNRISALGQLRAIASGFTANGQPVPPEVQNQINALSASLSAISPIGAAIPSKNAVAPSAIGAGLAPAPAVSVPQVKSESKIEPAATPAPVAPTVPEAEKKAETTEPAKEEPQKSEGFGELSNLPHPSDPSFLSKLDPAKNPQVLRNRAAATAALDPASATKLREEANQVEKDLMSNGYGMAPDGSLVKVPGWDAWKTEQENIGANKDYFNKQAQDAVARQYSRLQLDSIKKIVENFEPNKLADQFANIQSYLKAVGIDVPDTAKMNAVAFETFLKDTLRQVYADVKQFSGGVKVAELEGLEKQMAGPGLQAGTVENIVSQLDGSLNFADKHFNDAVDYRRSHKGAFDQANFERDFLKSNKLSEYVKDAFKNTSVLGAAPSSKYEFIPNKVYVLTRGPNGEPIKPVRKRFIKLSDTGNPIFADVQ